MLFRSYNKWFQRGKRVEPQVARSVINPGSESCESGKQGKVRSIRRNRGVVTNLFVTTGAKRPPGSNLFVMTGTKQPLGPNLFVTAGRKEPPGSNFASPDDHKASAVFPSVSADSAGSGSTAELAESFRNKRFQRGNRVESQVALSVINPVSAACES